MFIVRNSKGEVEMICNRREDALTFLRSDLDGSQYTIEDMSADEMDDHIIKMAEMHDDGIGEGQTR